MSATDARQSRRTAPAFVAPWAIIALIVGVASTVLPLQCGSASAPPAWFFDDGTTVLRANRPDEVALSGAVPFETQFVAPWTPFSPSRSDLLDVVFRTGTRLPPMPAGADIETVGVPEWVRMVAVGPEASDEQPSRQVRIEVADHLRSAEVSIERPDGTVRRCDRWLFGRWFCGPGDWNYVGPAEVQIRGRAEHCLWAHPTTEGTLVVSFPDLPRASLVTGRHGISDLGATSDVVGEFTFEVRVDGEVLESRRQARRRGMTSFRVATGLDEVETFDLEFRVGGETTSQRHFCFTALVRDFRAFGGRPEASTIVTSSMDADQVAPRCF